MIDEKLVDNVKAYLGLPPHDKSTNFVKEDWYFLDSLYKKYGTEAVQKAFEKAVKNA